MSLFVIRDVLQISVENGVLIANDTEGTVGNLTLFDTSHTTFR